MAAMRPSLIDTVAADHVEPIVHREHQAVSD
jgi:hypothetical protein